jgi:hypothetical protein
MICMCHILGSEPSCLRCRELFSNICRLNPDRFCGLVIRVPGYRCRGSGSIPVATRFSISSGSGTGFTQPREYN